MINGLDLFVSKSIRNEFQDFLFWLVNRNEKYLLNNQIMLLFKEYISNENKKINIANQKKIKSLLNEIPEMFFENNCVFILHRYEIAKYRIYQTNEMLDYAFEVSISQYLSLKDRIILNKNLERPSSIDLMPYYDYSPVIKDSEKIGKGINFLTNVMSSNFFNHQDEWSNKLFEFLKLHTINERQLLIDPVRIKTVSDLQNALIKALKIINSKKKNVGFPVLESDLQALGFLVGWGKDRNRVKTTMTLLKDLLDDPSRKLLHDFITCIPMTSKVVIVSPHGWFGQENVLGRPDTGGQIVYILDQVKALEKHLYEKYADAGLEITPRIVVLTRLIPNADITTANQRIEKIHETDHAIILRVPFKNSDGSIHPDWISRFDVWPYLEQYANDSVVELKGELGGQPDLIIGNYSDGNLVASLLAASFNVTFCTIAHALEKTKYLFSDLYWKDMDEKYHFSAQFTADLIAMNKANFIISSTYQEIAGTDKTIGQYESYQFFTMPELYQVHNGINLFHPKFNIIPPGVDKGNYFPYTEHEKRMDVKKTFCTERLFYSKDANIFGKLDDPEKPPLFTMARLDKIKNMTGLIEAYGQSEILKETTNLIVAAGTIDAEKSTDREEKEEIGIIYNLVNKYNLQGHIRWLPSIPKVETGEMYRAIADRKGVFVQPALFEAFGLTVLEAMSCGVPTVATMFGGPLEIIIDGKSGYLLNTSKPSLMSQDLERIIPKITGNPKNWELISKGGIKRVNDNFTWDLYSSKLINLTNLHGFWRHSVSGKGKIKLNKYCDSLYDFLYKSRLS